VKLHVKKFEDVNFKNNYFDFIFCFHTLEHTNSASFALKKIFNILKTDGTLFLEVPNIEQIQERDNVEEFFIDKHTFHFNRCLLLKYLKAIGFKIVFGEKDTQKSNITIIAEKKERSLKKIKIAEQGLVEENKRLIDRYIHTLEVNRNKLKKVGAILNQFIEKQRVAFWGGGRIFDSLVKYGNLNPQKAVCVVDKYLAGKIDNVYGIKLEKPEILKMVDTDVVIILAKSSVLEIEKEVRKYGVRHVIKFKDIIEGFYSE